MQTEVTIDGRTFREGDLVQWAVEDDTNKNLRRGDMGVLVRQETNGLPGHSEGLVVEWFTSDGGFGYTPERWFVAVIGDRLTKVETDDAEAN